MALDYRKEVRSDILNFGITDELRSEIKNGSIKDIDTWADKARDEYTSLIRHVMREGYGWTTESEVDELFESNEELIHQTLRKQYELIGIDAYLGLTEHQIDCLIRLYLAETTMLAQEAIILEWEVNH